MAFNENSTKYQSDFYCPESYQVWLNVQNFKLDISFLLKLHTNDYMQLYAVLIICASNFWEASLFDKFWDKYYNH